MLARTILVVIAFLAATTAAPAQHQAQLDAPALFASASQPDLLIHPHELRTLERLTFPLPSGPVTIDLRPLAERSATSYALVGSHPEHPYLHAMITVERGAMLARVADPHLGAYEYRHHDTGITELFEVEPPTVPECPCSSCAHDAASTLTPSANDRAAMAHAASRGHVEPSPPGRSVPRGSLCGDALNEVKALVLYTTDVLTAAGSEAQLLAHIQMSLDEFNLAAANVTSVGSPSPTVVLQHAALTTYPETTTSSSTHLNRLRDQADGFLDEAHILRDFHKADIVLLWTANQDFCGRAFIGVLPGNTPRPDLAFGTVRYSCALAPTYAGAHEIGHIMGLLHDFEADYCDTGAQTYAHGWVAPDSSFRTIMATSDTAAPRIPYFSSTSFDFMGQPLGDFQSRNGFALQVGAAGVVARYRIDDCNDNGVCDIDEILAGTLADTDGDNTPDICERDDDANGIPDDSEITNDPALDMDADGMLDSVEQTVHYVDPDATGAATGLSWANAHTDLHAALDAASRSGGDIAELWLADGTYNPAARPEERAAAYMPPSNLAIYGGFDGTETQRDQRDFHTNIALFDGDQFGQDNPSFGGHLDNSLTLMLLSRLENLVIDGLHFTGGYGDTKANCGTFKDGGAIFGFFSQATIRNCTFDLNAANSGGAIFFTDGSLPLIENCTFINNSAVDVDFKTAAGDIVTTKGSGSALQLFPGIEGEQPITVVNSRFVDNQRTAVVNIGGAPFYIGCLFDGNTGRIAAGVNNSSVNGSDATFINCTFVNNQTTGTTIGAAIRNFRSDINVINSIFWNNNPQVTNPNEFTHFTVFNTITLSDSIVEGFQGLDVDIIATNVSTADPLFADPQARDYRLQPGSSAIDASDNGAIDPFVTGPVAYLLDLDARERFLDDPATPDSGTPSIIDPQRPLADLGPFEFEPVDVNTCAADFNNDGQVDGSDFGAFGAAFGSVSGDGNYNPAADFNDDGQIDGADFGAFGAEFGRTDCLD